MSSNFPSFKWIFIDSYDEAKLSFGAVQCSTEPLQSKGKNKHMLANINDQLCESVKLDPQNIQKHYVFFLLQNSVFSQI